MNNCVARLHRSLSTGATFTEIDPVGGFWTGAAYNIRCYHSGVRMSRQTPAIVYWFGEMQWATGSEFAYLAKSQDVGVSWTEQTVPNAADDDRVVALRCTPGKTWRVVLHEWDNDDLYRSVNGCEGGGWTALDEGMGFDPSDLVLDQDDPIDMLTIGNSVAEAILVQRTTDEGDNWRDLTGNLDDDTGDYVTAVVIPRRI